MKKKPSNITLQIKITLHPTAKPPKLFYLCSEPASCLEMKYMHNKRRLTKDDEGHLGMKSPLNLPLLRERKQDFQKRQVNVASQRSSRGIVVPLEDVFKLQKDEKTTEDTVAAVLS